MCVLHLHVYIRCHDRRIYVYCSLCLAVVSLLGIAQFNIQGVFMDQLRDLHARGCIHNAMIVCGFMDSVSLAYLCYVLNVVFLFLFFSYSFFV